MTIDWTLFRMCNDLAGRSPLVDNVIRFFMNDYTVPSALVLLLIALWFSGTLPTSRQWNQRAVLAAFTSTFLGNVVVKAMNLAFYRPRPFANHAVNLLFYYPSDSSFPSNAAFVGFSVATAVWLFKRKMVLLMYALALLLALSRVCGGVHYPSDILGGMWIGIVSAYLVVRKLPIADRLWTVIIQQVRRFLVA
jgi:undecaprenyl-diphosphatase